MTKSAKTTLIMAATIAAAGFMSTTGAFAACAYSEWSNTLPSHPVATMTGRNCDGVHALKAIGADGHDFGWTPMQVTGLNTFAASFVGDDASNDVALTIYPLFQTMNVKIVTNYHAGDTVEWGALFKLDSIH